MTPDTQLLRDYSAAKSQDAFTELVRRHVDLVYSAALRQVRSPQLAEEISQSVFTDLARAADKLQPDTLLTAWLYQVARRTAIDVIRRESRRQARERLAVEMAAMNTAIDWTHIAPLLEDAMEALDETDRAAILLRYFENKSLREVGQSLGTSDDAAQKRVSRAVERLREFFSKRGVAVGASGLVVLISANAVHAAPIAFVPTISTAVLAATTIHNSTAVIATKAAVMTTLQKAVAGAVVAALVGTGIYQARQAQHLRTQVAALQQEQPSPNAQMQELQLQNSALSNKIATLLDENLRLKHNESELLTLRGEVGMLRQATNELAKIQERVPPTNQPARTKPQTEDEIMQMVRDKQNYARAWMTAFQNYAFNHNGELPNSFEDARQFFPPEVGHWPDLSPDDFEILYHGSLNAITNRDVIVFREKKLWQHVGGKWGRYDVLANGSPQVRLRPAGIFRFGLHGLGKGAPHPTNESIITSKAV